MYGLPSSGRLERSFPQDKGQQDYPPYIELMLESLGTGLFVQTTVIDILVIMIIDPIPSSAQNGCDDVARLIVVQPSVGSPD